MGAAATSRSSVEFNSCASFVVLCHALEDLKKVKNWAARVAGH